MGDALCIIWSEDLLLGREIRQMAAHLGLDGRLLGEDAALGRDMTTRPAAFLFVGYGGGLHVVYDQIFPFLTPPTPVVWLGEPPAGLRDLGFTHLKIHGLPVPLFLLRQSLAHAASLLPQPAP